MSSTKLPTSGQLAGPGIASRLCALEAAWAHGAASTASFSSRTHTEDVGLKCCSPTGFFFSSSTIWGTFLICALILKFVSFFLKMRKYLMFNSVLLAKLFFIILGVSLSWKCQSLPQYIYPESVYSFCTPNQSGACPALCGRQAHHSFMDPRLEDRMTPDRPRKCPRPPWLYK